MADFATLQQKYSPVVDVIKQFENYGAKFVGSELVGDQYHLVAQVASQVELNRVWDVIKQVDPQYADLKHEITNTGHDTQPYTIAPNDNLSKVSELFYGSAAHYEAIAKANNLPDANKIHPGQEINLPVL